MPAMRLNWQLCSRDKFSEADASIYELCKRGVTCLGYLDTIKTKSLMKLQSIIINITCSFLLSGCVLSKNATDKSAITYIEKNPALIKEAAAFAILATLGDEPNEFKAEDIIDPVMRKKISSLGTVVTVFYKANSYSEIPDSNVTFKTITIFGVKEVIFDFAAAVRHFKNEESNKKEYYFIRISDRIYYRRRPVPMM
jgi:hypothetical protein